MLVVSAMEWIPLFRHRFSGGVMIATGCVRLKIARKSITRCWRVSLRRLRSVLLTESGAATLLPTGLATRRGDPFWALVMLYVATVVMTELITNNAAGVLMPIAMAAPRRVASIIYRTSSSS
jgi:hypothetical protein